MKKNLLLIAAFAITLICKSQNYHYTPFPTSNAVWSEKYSKWNTTTQNYNVYYNKFALTGEDTLIGNKSYKKLYYFTGNTFIKDSAICFGGLREDSLKRVYMLTNAAAQTIHPTPPHYSAEKLLYDFSLNVGDTTPFLNDSSITVSKIDTILLGGVYRKRFSFQQIFRDSINQNRPLNRLKWVEGIGSINSGLYYFDMDEFIVGGEYDDNSLLCFTQNNQSVYVADGVSNCFPVSGLNNAIYQATQTTIFPNPTNHFFTVSVNNSSIKSVKLYNVTGQLVSEQSTPNAYQNQLTIDVASLKNGLYLCVVELTNGNTSTQKLVKQ